MEDNDIVKISFRGFSILILGSITSALVLIYLLFSFNRLTQEKHITEETYDTLYELKYHTDRLLTTHNLSKQKALWQKKRDNFKNSLDKFIVLHGNQTDDFNKLWGVIQSEIDSILLQLNKDVFLSKNTMDKSILRRLGELLSEDINSGYYIHLSQLYNSIEYLNQYETFLMDDLSLLRQRHAKEAESGLKEIKIISILLPSAILILTIVLAIYITRRVEKMEVAIIKSSNNLKKSLKELREKKDSLNYLAYHDPLTGLANRTMLIDRLTQSIKRAKRSNKQIAVLFIDLDHFKEINDSFGHSTGDELLGVVSKRLLKIMREQDTIARLGGDEFIMVIEDLHNLDSVYSISNKIISTLKEPIELHNNILHISSSIGISIYPDDASNAEMLVRNADSAMYYAKESGRSIFKLYTKDMTTRSIEKVKMEHMLLNAIKKEEFEVYYQPQVDARDGKLIGLEALVRWNHPQNGLVSPDQFLPVAEITGLIAPISEWVLQKTCEQQVEWIKKEIIPVKIAVNLSSAQLQDEQLFNKVKNILEQTACDASLIELEVTEGFVMKDPEQSIELLDKLNKIGIQISIDDFGTGYSSMSYLKTLPIQKLKIDKSFIDGVTSNSDDASITRTIIALAKGLNLKVIAEGVESIEQKEFLIQEGCNAIQGYFYSKPIRAKEVEELLKVGFINPTS